MVCKEIFACDHLFPTPTESESQLLEWLKSSSNDDDAEVKRTRYLVTEWDSFVADSHTNVRKDFRWKAKTLNIDIPRKVKQSADLNIWLAFLRTLVLQQAKSRQAILLMRNTRAALPPASVQLEDVTDILLANKFVSQCAEVSAQLRTSLVLKQI